MLPRKVLSLATALVLLTVPGLAAAQDPVAPPPAAPPAADAPPGEVVVGVEPAVGEPAGEERTEDILVTGTRVRRKDLTTPAPVTVVNVDALQSTGTVSIGDFLQSLPEQEGGINTQINNGGDGSSRVSLRNLSENRTLVLLNGRRFVPAGGNDNVTSYNAVDLNAIPAAAIERIEILKDGASAVYGSDAIAGVINIITKRNFSGTEVRALSGTSGEGDGTTHDLSATTGRSTDRGSVLFSVGYTTQAAIRARNRDFSSFDATHDFSTGQTFLAGSSYVPGTLIIVDPEDRTGNAAWTALLDANPGESAFTLDPGTNQWRPFRGNTLATDPIAPGDGFNYQQFQYLTTPSQRLQLFSSGDVNLGDVARGYFEASYVNRQSRATGLAPEPFDSTVEGVTISALNRFNPFGRDFSSEDTFVGRRLLEFGGRNSRSDVNTYRGVLGIDGTLQDAFGPLRGWSWDLSFNYGRTEGTKDKTGNLRRDRFQAAVGPSFLDDEGVWRCGTPEAGAIEGCVPLNLFGGPGSIVGPGNPTEPDQITPLLFQGIARNATKQRAFQANFGGELPGLRLLSDRLLGFATGYEYREESASFIPDPVTAAGDATGNKGAATSGGYSVHEFYAELVVPIVSAMPFAESVEATAATRYSDYSTFGSEWTYKFGGRWSIVNDLTLRGTFSTAYRAPSVGDLFQGAIDDFQFTTDPCAGDPAGLDPVVAANCTAQGVNLGFEDPLAQHRAVQGGNPNLQPETADIFTLGVVVVPRWVPNLSFTMDYWNIDIEDTILSGLGGQFILDSCYAGLTQYCGLIQRASGRLITRIDDIAVNVGATKTSGIDLAGRYVFPSPVGRWGLTADATYTIEYDQTQPDGRVYEFAGRYDDNGDFAYPRWKARAGVTWGNRGFGAGLTTRFLSGFTECADDEGFADRGAGGQCNELAPGGVPRLTRDVSNYYLFDAFVSYDLASRFGRTGIALGVLNMFDNEPNQVYSGNENHTYPSYDYVGRFFYVRLTQAL